ncbi:hypothetical protein JZ751_027336 [Albula glossodonta]|uniref:non-specific serine/threonine protein kinase n=1 Tax=Albula glossodonta TaxID=121402 RepID=A0A8T2NCG0_9TELE|nr:hypothetical protein JZ751_027336 [Albula glossodonta]
MVMDRLGKDLQKVCAENGGRLKRPTVLKLGCLLLDMLEFIHENEYVHADIKAANLLLGHRDPSKVYLADYGLSYRYCPEGVHKEYKENPKKGHNGTIEYTSTDAHNGVAPSRRGDLEVLGYCLLHWLCGKLPWDSMLKRPVMVQEAKAKLMANLPDSIMELSPSGTSTGEVAKFLLCVKSLGYKERPNYLKLRNILSEGLSKTAWKEGLLDLSGPREEARGPTPRSRSEKEQASLSPLRRQWSCTADLSKPMKVKPTAVEAPRPRPLPQEDSGFAAKADLPGRPPVHQRRPKMQPRLSHPQDEKKRQAQPKQMVRRVEVYDDDESDNEPNSENQGSPHHPYSLRERPPSKQDTSWGLKHWGGVITILFFLIFVILLVLEPQIPWSRKVEVL